MKDLIREHIRSFSARHSHYSRRDNAGRVYLSPELSISRVYQNFLQVSRPKIHSVRGGKPTAKDLS